VVGNTVGGVTSGVGNTLGAATGGVGKTLGDTTRAVGRGDLKGTVGGVTGGLGQTVGGVGRGLVSFAPLLRFVVPDTPFFLSLCRLQGVTCSFVCRKMRECGSG
jgi:hypothetical protein